MGKRQELERRIEELEAEVAGLKRVDLNRTWPYGYPYWSVVPPTYPPYTITCGTSTVTDKAQISINCPVAASGAAGITEMLSG